MWVFICHLPFLMGVLAFQLELESYSGEGNCLLLKRGACSRDKPPYAVDRGRVSSIGVERIFAVWFDIPHWWKWLLLCNMVPYINTHASSGFRSWDLSVCLYLNLKHGDLYHSATTAGLRRQLLEVFFVWSCSTNLYPFLEGSVILDCISGQFFSPKNRNLFIREI